MRRYRFKTLSPDVYFVSTQTARDAKTAAYQVAAEAFDYTPHVIVQDEQYFHCWRFDCFGKHYIDSLVLQSTLPCYYEKVVEVSLAEWVSYYARLVWFRVLS